MPLAEFRGRAHGRDSGGHGDSPAEAFEPSDRQTHKGTEFTTFTILRYHKLDPSAGIISASTGHAALKTSSLLYMLIPSKVAALH